MNIETVREICVALGLTAVQDDNLRKIAKLLDAVINEKISERESITGRTVLGNNSFISNEDMAQIDKELLDRYGLQ